MEISEAKFERTNELTGDLTIYSTFAKCQFKGLTLANTGDIFREHKTL